MTFSDWLAHSRANQNRLIAQLLFDWECHEVTRDGMCFYFWLKPSDRQTPFLDCPNYVGSSDDLCLVEGLILQSSKATQECYVQILTEIAGLVSQPFLYLTPSAFYRILQATPQERCYAAMCAVQRTR